MTREQALSEYVDCERTIERLNEKRANLKKIILGELIPPSPEIKRAAKIRGHGIIGQSRELVGKLLADNSHKKFSMRDISSQTGLRTDQVSAALYRLQSMHMVNKHHANDGTKAVTWSTAVHKDKSELNHM